MFEPFFSVIIPTRNRSDLLRLALQSIEAQTFPDFEVIIFDNASEDDTGDVACGFHDHRFHYMRSDKWINIQEATEEAFKVASGKFLHSMGDDDALTPHCLEKAKEVLESHYARVMCFIPKASYYHPDWIDIKRRNTLEINPFTKQAKIMNSRAELRYIFKHGVKYSRHPAVTNSFFLKVDFDYLIDRYGHILLNDYLGDISQAVFLLNRTDRYILLDEPLHICGFSGRSYSADVQNMNSRKNFLLSKETQTWLADKEKVNYLLRNVPLKTPIRYNFGVATLLQQKELLNLPYNYNWALYFKTIWGFLSHLDSEDAKLEKQDFFKALSKQSLWVQLDVFRVMTQIKIKNWI